MTRDEFLVKMDELLALSPGTLKGPEALDDLEQWDSVALMEFIALADANGASQLSPRQLANCSTIEDLLKSAGVGQ